MKEPGVARVARVGTIKNRCSLVRTYPAYGASGARHILTLSVSFFHICASNP